MATTQVQFGDLDLARAALRDVRSDSSETNWVVYVYDESNKLQIAGVGESDVNGVRELLKPTDRGYAFLRVIDVIDGHSTVKFIFITWAGDRVPVVKKARMATHKGSISEFIGQCHISIDASSPDDISSEEIMQRVRDASGSGSRVMSGASAPSSSSSTSSSTTTTSYTAPAPVPVVASTPVEHVPMQRAAPQSRPTTSASSSTPHPSVPKASQGLAIPDREALSAAIRAVRSDADPTNWALFGYEGASDNLVLIGTGSGDISELTSHLQDDQVSYGLYRTTDVYDGHTTVKFVFIVWIGERVKIMRKARIATHKGAITEFIGQYHCDAEATKLEELEESEIRRKVQFAAGTAVHVKH